jgi:membrane-bound metal-dependent hydrolase YbcI (DUF457 family)
MYFMDPFAHLSIGLAAAKLADPEAPLWVLGVATQVPDLLFFVFEAAGVEHQAKTHVDFKNGLEYLSQATLPWSHGFFMCTVWSVLAALIVFPFYRDLRTSLVVGSLVLSHWVLDFIVYPNLPLLFDDSPRVGLGLITSGPGFIMGIILDLGLIVAGIGIYFFT